MLYSRVLLGLLVLGSTTGSLVNSPEIVPEIKKPVMMLVCHYRPVTLSDGRQKSDEIVDKVDSVFVERINSDVVPLQEKSILQRFGINRFRRRIYFQAYFRTPPSSGHDTQPLADVKMAFRFRFARGLNLEWDDLLHKSHLKFHGAWGIPKELDMAEYRVTSKPGSVFPISLTVKNFQRDKPFNMLQIHSSKNSFWGSREAQAVHVKNAYRRKHSKWDLDAPPPVLKQLTSTLGHVLLSQALSMTNIQRFANMSQDGKKYTMTSYFRPRKDLSSVWLSSTVPVEVEIHAPQLFDPNKEYTVHTLTAEAGVACRLMNLLEKDRYYKVVIRGSVNTASYYDFTLLEHDWHDGFTCTGVELMIPDLRKPLPAPEVGDIDGTEAELNFIDVHSNSDSDTFYSSFRFSNL